MDQPMNKITVKFQEDRHETKVLEGDFKGMHLLDVVEDNGMHLSSNCGAVCACSTCHIYVEEGMDSLAEISDREEDFIDRAIDPTLESRLGCQCILLDGDAEIVLTVPDQSLIISHEH